MALFWSGGGISERKDESRKKVETALRVAAICRENTERIVTVTSNSLKTCKLKT